MRTKHVVEGKMGDLVQVAKTPEQLESGNKIRQLEQGQQHGHYFLLAIGTILVMGLVVLAIKYSNQLITKRIEAQTRQIRHQSIPLRQTASREEGPGEEHPLETEEPIQRGYYPTLDLQYYETQGLRSDGGGV
jgi:hypothetical protein